MHPTWTKFEIPPKSEGSQDCSDDKGHQANATNKDEAIEQILQLAEEDGNVDQEYMFDGFAKVK